MAFTLTSFAAHLAEVAVLLDAEINAGVAEAAKMLEREAKATYGSSDLAPNAEATVARKGSNSPGIETGETRDSISHVVHGHEAWVGTSDERAKWLEFGTMKAGAAWGGPNPPRPILGITMMKHGDEAAHIIGGKVMTAVESV